MIVTKTYTFIYLLIVLFVASIFWLYFTRKNAMRHTAEQIYHQLEKYQITYDIDAHSIGVITDATPKPIHGVTECKQHIAHLIAQNQPLKILLVGFPFKSLNHEKKTLGDLPDMAERKSLEYLQELLTNIKTIYPPGTQLTIFCDGTPYANFFGVSLQQVINYENTLKQLAQDLPNIVLHTSTDIMRKHHLANIKNINTLIDTSPPTDEEFKKSMPTISTIARKRFALELDHEAGRKILEHQTLDDITWKMLARETRMRNYISKQFPADHYLRFTVHFSDDVSKKFGIKLSPDADITPYHGILVEDGTSWTIRCKKDIDLKNYQLMTKKINGFDCHYMKRNK